MSDPVDDLPNGWARASLSEIGTWTGGGTPSKQQPAFWTDGTIPWVSPKDMKTDVITSAEDTITERAVEESSAALVEAGSVLFVTRSGILKHTLPVAVNRVDVTVNQDLKALTPATGIDPAYVLYFVQAFNREILRATVKDGTTVQSVRTKKLYDHSISIPPTAEQRRIVDALEAAFADLDAGVAALEAARRDLERYRRSVLTAAVQGDLTADWRRQHPDAEPASALLERVEVERRERWETDQLAAYQAKGKPPPKNWRQRYKSPGKSEGLADLPLGWARVRIEQVADTSSGGTPSRRDKSNFGGDIPWIKSGELNDGIIMSSEEYLTESGLSGSAGKLMEKGTLLMAMYGATVGRLGVLGLDAATNQAICAFAPVPSLSRDYLYYVLLGKRKELLAARIGGAQPNLSQSIINKSTFQIPPIEEQRAIVEAVNERLSVAEVAAAELDRQLIRADRLKRAVLQRAFAGNLVSQDPADEPAAVLLKRVSQELAERKKDSTPRRRRMKAPKDAPPSTLVKIVQARGPVEPHALWQASKHESIDDFYAALKTEVAAGRLREDAPSDTRRLIVLP